LNTDVNDPAWGTSREGARRPDSLITFLTDFGSDGGYVAACEAVMVSIQPRARVLHVSHEIAVGDVAHGALVLRRVAPLCPASVHLAVVDPGVGTARRPLVLTCGRGDILVGPDNGLLLSAAEALGGVTSAWGLDPGRLRPLGGFSGASPSSTFHGRDLFAPAAALLSGGEAPAALGTRLDPASLTILPKPVWRPVADGVLAEVLEVDRFGNVELAARFDESAISAPLYAVEVEGEDLPAWEARVVETFGQLQPGELGTFRDSWGYLALALNGASAAQLLSVERGMSVRLTSRQPRDNGAEA
jgi:S-adenosylmethionine hydrolase